MIDAQEDEGNVDRQEDPGDIQRNGRLQQPANVPYGALEEQDGIMEVHEMQPIVPLGNDLEPERHPGILIIDIHDEPAVEVVPEEKEADDEAPPTIPEDSIDCTIVLGFCIACAENFPDRPLATSSCKHKLCSICLQHLLEAFYAKEAKFLPQCCDSMDLKLFELIRPPKSKRNFIPRFLNTGLLPRIVSTALDQHVVDSFFRPRSSDSHSIAPPVLCGAATCTMCKGMGTLRDVPQMKSLPAQEKWSDCSQCHRTMNLRFGCFHDTYDAPFPYMTLMIDIIRYLPQTFLLSLLRRMEDFCLRFTRQDSST